jgi:hypothetical protein
MAKTSMKEAAISGAIIATGSTVGVAAYHGFSYLLDKALDKIYGPKKKPAKTKGEGKSKTKKKAGKKSRAA